MSEGERTLILSRVKKIMLSSLNVLPECPIGVHWVGGAQVVVVNRHHCFYLSGLAF